MEKLTIFLAAAGIAFAPQALAATDTATFNVTMTITASCEITNTTDLAFGSAAGLSTAVEQTSTIAVTCTNLTPYEIRMGVGANEAGGQRRMRGGATNSEYIAYDLYTDAARTTPWGNDVGSGVSTSGSGSAQVHTVYGRVPVQASPSPGTNYTDTVTVTVEY